MRIVTFAVAFLVAGVAGAQGTKATKEAAASAKAAVDKLDEAFNAHDAKTIIAALDPSYFGKGPTVSATFDDPAAFAKHLEQMTAAGGRMSRDALTIKADDDGDTAWYIADYTFIPKVPPGALPVRRKMRESGVLVRHGKEWKIAMWHMSALQPDPTPASAPATTPAPPPSGQMAAPPKK